MINCFRLKIYCSFLSKDIIYFGWLYFSLRIFPIRGMLNICITVLSLYVLVRIAQKCYLRSHTCSFSCLDECFILDSGCVLGKDNQKSIIVFHCGNNLNGTVKFLRTDHASKTNYFEWTTSLVCPPLVDPTCTRYAMHSDLPFSDRFACNHGWVVSIPIYNTECSGFESWSRRC